jgi:hypothetical protein
LNSLAVRGVSDRREDRSDRLDENQALVQVAVVEDRLDHVVAVRVTQELLQSRSVQHLADEDFSDLRVGDSDALLNDVGGESGVSTNIT